MIFLIWIAAAFFFPNILRKIHVPWVTAVIIAGIILGPYGLGWIVPSEIMTFLATIGLVLLMFSAGTEVKLSVLKSAGKDVVYFALLNLAIPVTTGFVLGFILGFGLFTSLVLGVCFGSSSVEVIVPTLKELKTEHKIAPLLTSAVFLEDVASLIILAILLKPIITTSPVPLELFPIALVVFLIIIIYLIPKLEEWLISWGAKKDQFSSQIRTVFIIVAIVAVLAEFIGVHAMVGGFLAGLALSKMLENRQNLQDNIFAISYGFLIPIFLLNLGITTNIRTLLTPGNALLTVLIIISLIASKTLSGFLGARRMGFPKRISWGMGFITTTKMSATLATAGLAAQYGIFTADILTAIVILSIVTIMVSPMLTKLILK